MLAGVPGHIASLYPKRFLFYMVHPSLVTLNSFLSYWQFQMPPWRSQTNETFWHKRQVDIIKETSWGYTVMKGKGGFGAKEAWT